MVDGEPNSALVGAIGFHLALWLFGWFVTIYRLIMLPALLLLLRAERRAATRFCHDCGSRS